MEQNDPEIMAKLQGLEEADVIIFEWAPARAADRS